MTLTSLNKLTSLRGFLLAYLGFVALHAGLRFAFSDAIAVDEVVEAVFTQHLALGYDPRQPPLYTWLLYGVHALLGPTAEAFHLLKYTLLGATLLCLRAAAFRMFGDARAATLAALAILFTYQVGWNVHDGVTHTLTLMLAIAAVIWLLTRLADGGGWLDYAALGLVLGLGLLSKYGFAAGPFALAIGALAWPPTRKALANRRILLTLVIAVAIAAPYYALWLPERAAAAYSLDAAAATMGAFERVGGALLSSVFAPLAFLSPLILVLAFAAPGRMIAPDGRAEGWERVLGVALLASFGVLLFGVFFGGVVNYAERWMHPLFLFGPLWLGLRWRRAAPPARRLRIVCWLFVGFVAISLLGRAAPYLIGPPACGKCRYSYPYADRLTPALEAVGAPTATIMAFDEHLAGNLRQAFPDARIVSLHTRFWRPPGTASPCIAVWDRRSRGDRPPLEAEAGVDGFGPVATIDGPVETPLGWRTAPTVQWAFAVAQGGCLGGQDGS